jgi:hypothetical protein
LHLRSRRVSSKPSQECPSGFTLGHYLKNIGFR